MGLVSSPHLQSSLLARSSAFIPEAPTGPRCLDGEGTLILLGIPVQPAVTAVDNKQVNMFLANVEIASTSGVGEEGRTLRIRRGKEVFLEEVSFVFQTCRAGTQVPGRRPGGSKS